MLIVGLITQHHTYLTIMKPVREAKARCRAVVPLMMIAAFAGKTEVSTIEFSLNIFFKVALGGLVVSVLATGPKIRGFKPGRGRWILRVIKSVARLPSEGK
jgi:hypothetical protein